MKRAAVLIAVRRAGALPVLRAAWEGVEMMRDWSVGENFDSVVCITDEHAPVSVKQVKTVIKDLVDTDSFDQLFVYFAGHGMNLRYNEYWLLSDAPEDTLEAVNVGASVHLAKRCGIPHVVIISDACRTAPEGIQAQAITGAEIFPNRPPHGLHKAVDVFYASLLGEPALEIKDQSASALRYQSIYTEEFLSALKGYHPQILSNVSGPDHNFYLRPHPLKRHLASEVPRLIAKRLGPTSNHSQTPDADILSDEFAVLQTFPPEKVSKVDTTAPPRRPRRQSGTGEKQPFLQLLSDILNRMIKSPVGKSSDIFNEIFTGHLGETKLFSEAFARETASASPIYFETGCGFRVLGIEIVDLQSGIKCSGNLISENAALIDLRNGPAAAVMLEFADGRTAVLPAIKNFVTTLTFEKGGIRNISYQPSQQSRLWDEYWQAREEVIAWRAAVSLSVHQGVFRLDEVDLQRFIEHMCHFGALDPALAVYAAYACSRIGRQDLIPHLEVCVSPDLAIQLFDTNFLAGQPVLASRALPAFPLLGQGWSLLAALGARSPVHDDLQRHISVTSLWTLFEPSGIESLRKLILS